MQNIDQPTHLSLLEAYVAVIDQEIPLVDEDPDTGEREWTREMRIAMLRHIRVEASEENLVRLHDWLMTNAAEPDYSRFQ